MDQEGRNRKFLSNMLRKYEAVVYCELCQELIDRAEGMCLDDGTWICIDHYEDNPMLAHGIGCFPEDCDPYN
jgi:hypothetical protein